MRSPFFFLLLILPARGVGAQDTATTDLARMQGDWLMVGSSANGQTVDVVPEGLRQVAGDTITVTINGQVMMEATFHLDPGTDPKAIDYSVFAGPLKGTIVPGVYRFDGEKLVVCVGGPNGARPTDFVADANEPGWCSVWERH
jgi:uncharacterized protein (TIGR03067 family)